MPFIPVPTGPIRSLRVEQEIISERCHRLKGFAPSLSGTLGGPNNDRFIVNLNVDIRSNPGLVQVWLWNPRTL
jgi:hypothetical protein